MAVVTKTQLENAFEDCQALEDVLNGSEVFGGNGLVTTRLGTVLQTVKKIINDLAELDIGESAAATIHERIDALEARVYDLEHP